MKKDPPSSRLSERTRTSARHRIMEVTLALPCRTCSSGRRTPRGRRWRRPRGRSPPGARRASSPSSPRPPA